jgi:hypothetical protein
MAKNAGSLRLTDNLLQVAAFLKQADKLVREHNYVSALEQIAKARGKDPSNSYAEAYEQRVKLLVNALNENKQARNSASSYDSPTPHSFSQHLESIANLAIQEANRAANLSLQQESLENAKSDLRIIPPDTPVQIRKDQRETPQTKEAQIRGYIHTAEDLLRERHLDEALNTLAPAILVDPLNGAILELERQIRDAQEEEILIRLRQFRGENDEVKKAREGNSFDIQKCIVRATQLAERKEFSEALMEIGQGYLLDPFNVPLAMCEKIVLAALGNESHHTESQPSASRAFTASSDGGYKDSKTKTLGYLDKAQAFLSEDRFAESLAQVALAMIAVQDDHKAEENRRELHTPVESGHSNPSKLPGESESTARVIDEGTRQIFGLLDDAKRHASKAEYGSALEDLLQASYLIPSDGSLEYLNRAITEKFMEYYQLLQSGKTNAAIHHPRPSASEPAGDSEDHRPVEVGRSSAISQPGIMQSRQPSTLAIKRQPGIEDRSTDDDEDSIARTKEHLVRSLRHLNGMRLVEASVEGELASLVDSSRNDVGSYAMAVSSLARKTKAHTPLNALHDQYDTVRQQAIDLIHGLCYEEILDGIDHVLQILPANNTLLKRREEVEGAFEASKHSLVRPENTKGLIIESPRRNPVPVKRTKKHSLDQIGLSFSGDLESVGDSEGPREDIDVPDPFAVQKSMRRGSARSANSPYIGN